MKKLILTILVVFSIFSCKEKIDDEKYPQINMVTIDSWSTINFKTNYTIQIPDGFEGIGMAGFEGNTFSKFSPEISLSYGYCNGLFCFDFGDTLKIPFPKSIQLGIGTTEKVTLTEKEYFNLDTTIVGVFYYLKNTNSMGRLFFKDHDSFKAALEVIFPLNRIQTVDSIIGTIKHK